MGQSFFDISQWARRIGLKNVPETPFIPSIQPVAVVGDHSALTPALVPPAAAAGGTVTAAAGEHAYVAVFSLAPGGAIVASAEVNGTGNDPRFGVIQISDVTGIVSTFPARLVSNEAPQSRAVRGVNLAANRLLLPLADWPIIPFGILGAGAVPEGMYVPTGSALVIEATTPAATMGAGVVFADVPAREGVPS